MMTNKEIEKVFAAAQKRVIVHCSEFHQHSPSRGCIVGKTDKDEDAVTICMLCEDLMSLREKVSEFATEIFGE